MTLGQQLVMMLTLMLASKGVAGVPRGALVVLTATLTQFGLPLEGAAILLGIDQIMDMGRTAVNVMGNCIATAVVARWEGVLKMLSVRIAAGRMPEGQRRARQLAPRVRARSAAHDVVAFDALDARRHERRAASRGVIARARPDAIVNCAALQRRRRRRGSCPSTRCSINAFAVRALARAAAACGAALVHYSTDFVFDGTASQPYTEDGCAESARRVRRVEAAGRVVRGGCAARVRPAGREPVRTASGRTAREGQRRGDSRMRMQSGSEARVFEDRTVSPTYVVDAAIGDARAARAAAPPGLYHCVNSGSCTWLDLARELASNLGSSRRCTPVRMADAKLRAERPRYCALSNAKLASVGIAMPTGGTRSAATWRPFALSCRPATRRRAFRSSGRQSPETAAASAA